MYGVAMPNRRARHQVDRRPITLVLAHDQNDWLAWCEANGYTPTRAAGYVLGQPYASATCADTRALRVVDHIDATIALGHDLVETDRFSARADADNLRRWGPTPAPAPPGLTLRYPRSRCGSSHPGTGLSRSRSE